MLIVIEGINCTGKTTLVNNLGCLLHITPFKCWKSNTGEHWTKDEIDYYRKLGISVNSFEEEMYFSFFISKFDIKVIKDRDLISALVYSKFRDEDLQFDDLFDIWKKNIRKHPGSVFFVYLYSTYSEYTRRVYHRRNARALEFQEWCDLKHNYDWYYNRIPFNKFSIDTTKIDEENCCSEVIRFIDREQERCKAVTIC